MEVVCKGMGKMVKERLEVDGEEGVVEGG